MTRHTQQALIFVVTSTLALGVIGWLIWKFGFLDVVMAFIINFALLFPLAAVFMLVLNRDTYNDMVDTLWATQDAINNMVAKSNPFKAGDVDVKGAIPAP